MDQFIEAKINQEIFYDCFSTTLNDSGCVDIKYERFNDIYTALIWGYKNSYTKFKHNIPKNVHFFPGYNYISVIRRFHIKCYEHKSFYNEYITSGNVNIKIYHNKIRKAQVIQRFYKQRLQKKLAAIILIQRNIRHAISNPYTTLCRKRLMREFLEM